MKYNIDSVTIYLEMVDKIQMIRQFMLFMVFIGFLIMVGFLFLAIFKKALRKIMIVIMILGMLIEISGACGLIKATNELGKLNNAYNVFIESLQENLEGE